MAEDGFGGVAGAAEDGGALRTLDARYYTDAQVFARARDEIFYKTWQHAGHLSQIPEPGDYLSLRVVDQDIVVVRGRKGEIRAFYNVCQHRGHRLVEGCGRTRVLVCPYHAWTYELDGRLRAAPNAGRVRHFNKRDVKLTEVRVDTLLGFVFVNLDPDAAPIRTCFPGVEEAATALCANLEDRVFAHQHEAEEHCNWLIAVENYNECYHCKIVHPTFAAGVIDPASYNVAPFGEGKCLNHTAGAASGDLTWYDTSGSDYGSFYLWPSFSLQIYPGGLVNTYTWRPLAQDNTVVYRGWLSRDGVVDDALQKVIDLDRDTTFAEDLVLVREVQRGLGSRGYRPGPLILDPEQGVDSEHSIAALHGWVRDALA